MKFVINEIKLWFRDEATEPKSYYFLPDKVNVITGDATTGKTSFWSIIDFCLLSDKVNTANTINQKVLWYGLNFTVNGKELSIVRKSPDSGKPSEDVYFGDGSLPKIPLASKEVSEVKSILDLEFGITDQLRFPHGKDKGPTNFNLSFRYFLLFNSLTEDIIGASRTYFDTTFYGKEEYDKALEHIFDLVIGVNDMDNIKARERLRQVDNELGKFKSLEKTNEKKVKSYHADIFALIEKCKEAGLLDYNEVAEDLDVAKFVLDSVIANTRKAADSSALFAEINRLEVTRNNLKIQINAINRYKNEFDSYKRNLAKSADSLQPIEFLNGKLADQLVESYETKIFVDSLEASLREIKSNLAKKVVEPVKVTGDLKELNQELTKTDKEIEELNKLKQNFLGEGEKFIRLGEIRHAYLQILEREGVKPIDTIALNRFNEEKLRLLKIPVDNQEIKFSMKTGLNKSIQRNYDLLSSLSTYQGSETRFDDSKMILQLVPPGQLFPLDNVGSKSNYMLMHLCFYLGLHEHMINVQQQHVPQFLFIDQPSIPYYSGNDGKGNNDKGKLVDAFSLLNSFVDHVVKEKKDHFQIFMVEHAPRDYWEEADLTYFHTVAEFIGGVGLIPDSAYSD
jgi:hypothetical protein